MSNPFNSVPTVHSLDAWSPAENNTYLKGNFAALWPYLAAGDIAVATDGSNLGVLSKPSVLSAFTMDNSGVPAWVAIAELAGALHAKGIVDFAPSQTFTSTWADITSATLTLTLTKTCTIFVFGGVSGWNDNAGNSFLVRSVCDGVADVDPGYPSNSGQSIDRLEALPYFRYFTGVAAGSRIVKLQCEAQGTNNFVGLGRLIALAFVE